MKKVYTTPSAPTAHIASELLEDNGIEAVVQGENLSMLAGEIPWQNSWPTVWVNDADEAAALELLKDFDHESSGKDEEDWICPTCGERIEGSFGGCWKCAEAGQPEAPVPAPAPAPAPKPAPEGLSPLALRLLTLSRRMVNGSGFTAIVLFLSALLLGETLAIAFLFALALTLLFVFLRFLIIVFFIARYSLRQMLGAIIILNILLVLIVSLSGLGKVFSIVALIVFIQLVSYYILAQNPAGLGCTPNFIREYLNRKQKPPK